MAIKGRGLLFSICVALLWGSMSAQADDVQMIKRERSSYKVESQKVISAKERLRRKKHEELVNKLRQQSRPVKKSDPGSSISLAEIEASSEQPSHRREPTSMDDEFIPIEDLDVSDELGEDELEM